MDLFAHACFGAVICSRSGMAGGRSGAGKRWYADRTVWGSVFFGLLPDIVSMWIPFFFFLISGSRDNFFHLYDGKWLEIYRLVHSLVLALGFCLLMLVLFRKRGIVSLAWPVHVVCDAVSHDGGKFRTMLLYPFSEWSIHGVAFWRHGWFVLSYWALIVAMFLVLRGWRRSYRQ